MNLITQLSLTCREYVNANGSKRGYSGCAVDIVFSVEVEENFIFLFSLHCYKLDGRKKSFSAETKRIQGVCSETT